MSHSAHRELALEVYSTIRVRPRGAGADEIPMRQPGADTSHYEIYFRMFGDDIHLSMEEFAVMLGLYTPAEVRLPLYTNSIHHLPSDYLRVWWGAISDKPFGKKATKARVSDIRDPLHRYLHRLIAKSVTGRKEGTEHCNLRDLFFVWCLLTHTHTATSRDVL
ncbi:uncharacterized protein LOC143583409 [Bidens hawaiensis]|uniref:uncharacterized protein LOC143583409 n=1 Tax=Bidens hawaiensis TaxID=980011 RepID=UPI0040495CCA